MDIRTSPKIIDRWIVILSIFVVMGYLVFPLLPDSYFASLSYGNTYIDGLIHTTPQLLLILLLSILFITGMRALRKRSLTLKYGLYLFIGLVGLLAGTIGMWWITTNLEKSLNFFEIKPVTKFQYEQVMSAKHISVDIKHKFSKGYAETIYLTTGTATTYLNQDGKTVMYKPGADVIESHRNYIGGRAGLREYMNLATIEYYIWAGVLLFSLIFSYRPLRPRIRS